MQGDGRAEVSWLLRGLRTHQTVAEKICLSAMQVKAGHQNPFMTIDAELPSQMS